MEDLMSVGHGAELYQVDPRVLRHFLRQLGAEPALILNGLEYFHSRDMLGASQAADALDRENERRDQAAAREAKGDV